ncbi:hypothetical protein ACHAQA_008166 [Verticillium albo-atrum]
MSSTDPQAKRARPWDYAYGVGVVILCVIGCLCVTPKLNLGWRLGLVRQIQVIGVVVSFMGILSKDPIKHLFLLCDARFGNGGRATKIALNAGSTFGAGDNWKAKAIWIPCLGIMSALPVALGVLYKEFLGGFTDRTWPADNYNKTTEYDIDFPRIGLWAPAKDPIYLLSTSFAPFQTASGRGEARYPTEFPQAYGYNTLLLSNDSAAIIDIPTEKYAAALRPALTAGDHFLITATVSAYVATRDPSSSAFVADDALWEGAYERRQPELGLTVMSLYLGGGENFGILPFGDRESTDNNRLLISLYYNSTFRRGMYSYDDDTPPEELERFRAGAQLYDISRQRCTVTWTLNETSLLLTNGSCNGEAAPRSTGDSSVLLRPNVRPFQFDIMPPLVHTYAQLAQPPGLEDLESPWLRATHSVSAVTMYWARALYIFLGDARAGYQPEPGQETIVLVRHTLQGKNPLLYVVLAVLPFVTTVSLILAGIVGIWGKDGGEWDCDDEVKRYLNGSVVTRLTLED